MGDFDKSSLNTQWAVLNQTRANFVSLANGTWLPDLLAGAPRNLINEIGHTATTLLKKMLNAVPADLEDEGRRDIGNPTWDMTAWHAAAVPLLQALTLQVESDYNATDGKLFNVARDAEGRLTDVDIIAGAGQTVALRAAISAAVAALE